MDIDAIQALPADCTTREVAQALGMAVRSVQLMVDRGELQAWKTPGGHRRIARASVLQWLQSRPASNTGPTNRRTRGSLTPALRADWQAGSFSQGPE